MRLFATLQRYLPPGQTGYSVRVALPEGAKVKSVLSRLGMPGEIATISLVNGVQRQREWQLAAGDVVSLFPPLGGG